MRNKLCALLSKMKGRDVAALLAQCVVGRKYEPLNIGYLNDSQNNCVAELSHIIEIYGGALLADPVGSGKTRIAIAIAAEFGVGTICVVAPARTRTHWISEIEKCGDCALEFFSHSSLSNNRVQPTSSFVVVDEAHRFRNPKAKRSIELKKILETRSCILVSATPFVNRERDLFVLIRYFLDDEDARRRLGIDPANANHDDLKFMLLELCVRRSYTDIPAVNTTNIAYHLSDKEGSFVDLFQATLSEIHFEALRNEWSKHLVRRFLQSQFRYGLPALAASLKSIALYCLEWISAAEKNLGMNRRFFRESFPNGQLPLDFMYPKSRSGEREKVEMDLMNLNVISDALSGVEFYSLEEIIIRSCLENEQALIFAARIVTAESLFKRCLKEGFRVGLVHSKRAVMSGIGEAAADEIVSRFRDASIRLLIATDCLSEGISFPECTKLIFVDIPDTAVKIEQRIGRITRLNSRCETSQILVPKLEGFDGYYPDFAKEKSERSSRLGFQYTLAANLLGTEKVDEDPFRILLDCRNILRTSGRYGLVLTGTQFVMKTNSHLSSLSLVRVFDREGTFSFQWVAISNGQLTTNWSDIRETIEQMSQSEAEIVEEELSMSKTEALYFHQLVNRRNLSRFRPSKKKGQESLSKRLAQSVSGFALSDAESRHVSRILVSPFSRGRRLQLESLLESDPPKILETLLELNVRPVSKLVYEVIFRLRFTKSLRGEN